MERDPLSVILSFSKADITADSPLDVVGAPMDLRRAMYRFAELRPDLLPRAWVDMATSPIARREVVLGLIRQMHRMSRDPSLPPGNSLQVLCESSGLDYNVMNGVEYSSESLSLLYQYLLDTQLNLADPAYASVTIEPALLRQKRPEILLEVFEQLKNLLYLNGNNNDFWLALKNELKLTENGITVANVNGLLQTVNAKLIASLGKVLEDQGAQPIEASQYQALTERWVDTQVFLTLLARYNSRAGWRPTIRNLVKIIKFDLEGEFLSFKRFGDPSDALDQAKAKAQTAVLKTDAQQNSWWKQWARVALFDVKANNNSQAGAEEEALALRDVKTLIAENLAPTLSLESASTLENSDSVLESILNSEDAPAELFEALGCSDPRKAAAVTKLMLDRMQVSGLNVNQTKKLLGFFKAMIAANRSFVLPGAEQVYSRGVASIFSRLKQVVNVNVLQDDEIVVTVTSHSPRVLLSLATLVSAGSCMNPDTGERANVNPSTAIDANVQALFSNVHEESDFKSTKEFLKVKEWLHSNAGVEVFYEGNQGLYTFLNLASGQSVVTRNVTDAFLRYQLKVGATKKGLPGVRTEKPFFQSHPAMALMNRQVEEIKASMAQAMGGVVDVEINLPVARNLPAGTYSDALNQGTANGLSREAFTMPVATFPIPK